MSNFKMLQVTDVLSVQVMPEKEHQFIMTTNQVAHGYDCATTTVRDCLSRNRDEFEEGKHFLKGVGKPDTLGGSQPNQTFWTKRGIVRLGFFLKTGNAKLFRDWAEDLIISRTTRRATLREDEVKLIELLNQHLILGDQRSIADKLKVKPRTVSAVKCGRTRSARIMGALVEQALQNKASGRQLMIGYSADFVNLAVRKLEGGYDA